MTQLTIIWLILYIGASLLETIIIHLNGKHFSKKPLPKEFTKAIDAKTYTKAVTYNNFVNTFTHIQNIISSIIIISLVVSGGFTWLILFIENMGYEPLPSGLLFFGCLYAGSKIISIPLSLYRTFVIEEKFGFNKQTLRLWISDFIKGMILSIIIGGAIMTLIISMIYNISLWFLWVWGTMFLISLIMVYIYPICIAPLFNKFIPLKDTELEKQIKKILQSAGLKIKAVFQMDASKRSSHSNAYFTGLGNTKRIVLFDTLLKQQTHDEIVATLAHEAGHWKKKHIVKGMIISQGSTLILLWLAYIFLHHESIYQFIGLSGIFPYVGLLTLSLLYTPISYFLSPISYYISRKFEYEADAIGVSLTKKPQAAISSLIGLYKDNLANVNPHWLYTFFHASHPDPISRIEALKNCKH